jgi:transposase InsO family protein
VSGAGVRVGVGTRLRYDGETVEVVELLAAADGNVVLLRDGRGGRLRLSLSELLVSGRAQVIPESAGPSADDPLAAAGVVLGQLSESEAARVVERAAHVREVLTGYRSGSAELAGTGEPRTQYAPLLPLSARYAAKAEELGIGERTVRRWVHDFRQAGEAGLAAGGDAPLNRLGRADTRWVEVALEVMVEHTGQSKPSRTMVIERANARVIARLGPGVVKPPSRSAAFRILAALEQRHPTFRLSTTRNRDIAGRPDTAYGKLRPTRPGEYMLMDTTRLDVFGLDPVTLRWVQAELTVSMDWYTRCVTGIRVTPVSTKAIDASSTLYQAFRPRPAGADWPEHAVWPQHGIPRTVMLDPGAIEGPIRAAGPAIVPETIVVDHGRIYVSAHLTSVCQRMGVSIQPVRLRTGRDKGPLERFFRTLREDLLQALPGYKGPDLYSRGESPEKEAFFFLNELEEIIREWAACVYHRRPHAGLVEAHLPNLALSPAAMFEHGLARAGYIEAPRDPDLALEFLRTEWRTIQHYGVEIDGRRYDGAILKRYEGAQSPYRVAGADGRMRRRWPIQVNPDDITAVYFRDPADHMWHTLAWEHAPSLRMPLSDEALRFARQLAAARYRYPDDKAAVGLLLERWNLGLGSTLAERRIALRLSREQAAFDLPQTGQDPVTLLPSVARALGAGGRAAPGDMPLPAVGDDDEDDLGQDAALQDFYADALQDV